MRRILTGAVCAALCAGTVVVAGTAPALAATSAAAKKVPVLAVKQSASKVATGGTITFTPSLHLPAHDKLASWALTFGDGSKTGAKAKSLPHSVKHAYKKKLSGHAVLTVTDTKKHHWSVSLPISVVTLTFAGGGAAATGTTTPAGGAASTDTTTTGTGAGGGTDPGTIIESGNPVPPPPPPPVCTFPATASYAGPLKGHVSDGVNPLAGIVVTVTDGVSSTLPSVAKTTTDSKGNWTLPAGTVAPGQYGYDVKINDSNSADDPDAADNPLYDVEELSCMPATNYNLVSVLPITTKVTGSVVGLLSVPSLVTAAAMGADGHLITAIGTVVPKAGSFPASGTYTIQLGQGLTWTILAPGFSNSSTLPVTAATTSGPTILVA